METMDRDGLESMDWTEGQADWRAGNLDKLTPGAERSRETAGKHGTAKSAVTGQEKGQKEWKRALVMAFSAPRMWTISLVNSEM